MGGLSGQAHGLACGSRSPMPGLPGPLACFPPHRGRRAAHEELWAQPALEMPKRRDVLAVVLIVLPWTLLVTVWHQSTVAPLLATRKGESRPPGCRGPGDRSLQA